MLLLKANSNNLISIARVSRTVKGGSYYFFYRLACLFVLFYIHVNQAGTNHSVPSYNNNPADTSANDLSPEAQMVEKVHQQLSQYPVGVLQAAGHQLDDLILSCIYNSYECL